VAYELPALLALFADDPSTLALLGILSMFVAAVRTAAVLALLVYEHTANTVAAYVAGTVLLILPRYYELVATGLRPKYFVALFGLLSVFSMLRDR